jgi:hypothetical protein
MEKKVVQLELETTGFDQVEQQTKSLKAQLREAQNEVNQLAEKFGATSAEAVKAAKRASELKDAIADAKDLTDSFNPDAKFNSLTRSIGGAMDGFSAFQGTLGLIGVESQDVEKMILKVQSAMALSQGLQGLMEAKDSFKQLGAVISDTFKGIKGALLASGIGAFVVLLGTVVAYWDDISEAVGFASAGQKAYNSTLEQYTQGAKEAIQTTQKVGTAFEMAKEGVISKEEALATYNETLGDSFGKATTLAEAEKLYNDKVDDYVKAMALRAQANALFELSAQKAAEQVTSAMEDNTTFLDKSVLGFKMAFQGAEEGIGYYNKQQKQRTKERNAQLEKEKVSIENVAKSLLKEAETTEKANGIKSESEIKLANERKQRAKEVNDIEQAKKKEALENIQALEAEYALYQKTEQEKEIFAVQEKYKKSLEDSEKYHKDNSQLLLAQKNELNDIDAKYKQLEVERAEKTAEELKAIQEKANADYIQAQDDRFNLENELTLNEDEKKKLALQQAYEKQIEIAGDDEGLIKQATKKLQDDLTAIDEDSAKKRKEAKKQEILAVAQMSADALNLIATIAEDNAGKDLGRQKKAFQIRKAANLAQATVDGTKAVLSTYADTPGGPVIKGIAAGLAGAFALVQIRKIAMAKFEGGNQGGGGGGSMGGGGGNDPATQTVTSSAPSFQIVGNSGTNPLAGLGGAPIKAYVVSSEVTTSQQLDRNHVKNATFG